MRTDARHADNIRCSISHFGDASSLHDSFLLQPVWPLPFRPKIPSETKSPFRSGTTAKRISFLFSFVLNLTFYLFARRISFAKLIMQGSFFHCVPLFGLRRFLFPVPISCRFTVSRCLSFRLNDSTLRWISGKSVFPFRTHFPTKNGRYRTIFSFDTARSAMREKGLEPPRQGHQILSLARLPIPPFPPIIFSKSSCLLYYPSHHLGTKKGWVKGFEPSISRATIWRPNQLGHTHHSHGFFIIMDVLSSVKLCDAIMIYRHYAIIVQHCYSLIVHRAVAQLSIPLLPNCPPLLRYNK